MERKIGTNIFTAFLLIVSIVIPFIGCETDDNSTLDWLQEKIDYFEGQPPKNPPVEITKWEYNGRTVYFIPAYCCDVFSELYDENGKLICHPDGGLTGEGDGKCPDFFSNRENRKVVWKDTRIILSNGSRPEDWPLDSYVIEEINLDNNTLSITVSYSGGCREHEFQLVAWNYFMESFPVQAAVVLSHNANDDMCEAYITEELSFDLSPLKDEYSQQYSTFDTASIILQLYGGSSGNADQSVVYSW